MDAPRRRFTFQYGSTLMVIQADTREHKKELYIPIWFYFNP